MAGLAALVIVLLVVIVVLLFSNKAREEEPSTDMTSDISSGQEVEEDTIGGSSGQEIEEEPSGLSGEMDTFSIGSVTFTVPREWDWHENEYGTMILVPSADELFYINCYVGEAGYFSDDDYLMSAEQNYDGYRYISFEEDSVGGISGKLHTYYAVFDLDYTVSSFYFTVGDDLMNVVYMRSTALPDSRQPLEEVMGSMRSSEETGGEDLPSSDAPVQDSYGEGTYEAGLDIPAGEYVLLPETEEGGSYAVRSSADQETEENLIDYDVVSYRTYITIEEGQYLTIYSCEAVPSGQAPALDLSSGVLPNGTYKVGIDIPAGEYLLRCYSYTGRGVYTVKSSSQITDKDSAVIASGTFDDETVVTVKEGQYLSVGGAEIFLP